MFRRRLETIAFWMVTSFISVNIEMDEEAGMFSQLVIRDLWRFAALDGVADIPYEV